MTHREYKYHNDKSLGFFPHHSLWYKESNIPRYKKRLILRFRDMAITWRGVNVIPLLDPPEFDDRFDGKGNPGTLDEIGMYAMVSHSFIGSAPPRRPKGYDYELENNTEE